MSSRVNQPNNNRLTITVIDLEMNIEDQFASIGELAEYLGCTVNEINTHIRDYPHKPFLGRYRIVIDGIRDIRLGQSANNNQRGASI